MAYDDSLAELHAPLTPILRHVLASTPLPRAGLALDLACGPGLKAPLLAEVCGPGVRLVGIDIDRAAIRAATIEDRRSRIEDRRPKASDPRSSIFDPRSSKQSSILGVVADALALPLRGGCCAAAFCIAALSLFADRRAGLRELRRVLAPDGLAILVVGTQFWAQIIRWPAELAARLVTAYAQALDDGIAPLPTTPDLAGDLADLLFDTGFRAPHVRAFRLDRPPTTDHRSLTTDEPIIPHPLSPIPYPPSPIPHPLAAELPLLSWPALRPLLVGRLEASELARCDEFAADPEIELCALALVAQTYAKRL